MGSIDTVSRSIRLGWNQVTLDIAHGAATKGKAEHFWTNKEAVGAAVSQKALHRKDRMNVEAIQKNFSLKAQAALDGVPASEGLKAFLDMMFKYRMAYYGESLPLQLRIEYIGYVIRF